MSDPVDDLLQRFRADVPEPDDEQRGRAFQRATAGPHRRRRPVALALVGAALVAAAIAGVLIGSHGAPGEANAATIVRRVIAANEQPATGILHERYEVEGVPFAGAGRIVHATVETWRELGGQHRFRTVDDGFAPQVGVEVAGSSAGLTIYDPRTDGLYRLPSGTGLRNLGPFSSAAVFSDFAETLRDDLRAGRVADVWKVARTELDGRAVYRIANTQSSELGPTTYYVDAETYAPVRVDEPGPPKDQPGGPWPTPRMGYMVGRKWPPSVTVTRISTYETMPATDETLALLDEHAAHPSASELPVSQLRPDLAAQLVRSSAPVHTVPTVKPLLVDPLRGTIGSFHVGENLLALSKIVSPPMDQFQLRPGNLRDGAVSGTSSLAGTLAVTFRDGNQEHSTSALLSRPFTTTRGDRSGDDGTTLAEFLARWPEHGPTAASSRLAGTTAVPVGAATFYFDDADRLAAVQLGDGDAWRYWRPVR